MRKLLPFVLLVGCVSQQVQNHVLPPPVVQPVEQKPLQRPAKPIEQGVTRIRYTGQEITVRCEPLHITDVALLEGETISTMAAGDQEQWSFLTSQVGKTPHVLIKPHYPHLTTNLVIHTNVRPYSFTLKSGKGRDQRIALYVEEEPTRPQSVKTQPYHYGWTIEGSYPWSPVSVYDDNERVFITMPAVIRNYPLPLVYEVREGKNTLINYTVKKGLFILPRLSQHLVMFAGKNGERVTIRRAQ